MEGKTSDLVLLVMVIWLLRVLKVQYLNSCLFSFGRSSFNKSNTINALKSQINLWCLFF